MSDDATAAGPEETPDVSRDKEPKVPASAMALDVTAILVDPGVVPGFESILKDFPLPLLPLGTKPLIAHWLERLAEMGVKRVRLLLNHFPERTRQFVGDGSRWGLTVSYAATRSGQGADALWALVSDIESEGLLVGSLESWPERGLAAWFQQICSGGGTQFDLGAGQWLASGWPPWRRRAAIVGLTVGPLRRPKT